MRRAADVLPAHDITQHAVVVTQPKHPFTIVDVNRPWERLCGYTRDEALKMTCAALQGPNTDRAEIVKLHHAIATHTAATFRLVNYTKARKTFINHLTIEPLVDDEGNVTHFLGTLRPQLPKATQPHHMRRAQDILPADTITDDAVVITNANHPFGIVDVNRPWERLCGYTRDEALKMTCAALQGPHTDRSEIDKLHDALSTHTTATFRLVNYTKARKTFINHLTIEPLVDDEGNVTHFLGTLRPQLPPTADVGGEDAIPSSGGFTSIADSAVCDAIRSHQPSLLTSVPRARPVAAVNDSVSSAFAGAAPSHGWSVEASSSCAALLPGGALGAGISAEAPTGLLSRDAFPLYTLHNHPIAPVLLRLLQLSQAAQTSGGNVGGDAPMAPPPIGGKRLRSARTLDALKAPPLRAGGGSTFDARPQRGGTADGSSGSSQELLAAIAAQGVLPQNAWPQAEGAPAGGGSGAEQRAALAGSVLGSLRTTTRRTGAADGVQIARTPGDSRSRLARRQGASSQGPTGGGGEAKCAAASSFSSASPPDDAGGAAGARPLRSGRKRSLSLKQLEALESAATSSRPGSSSNKEAIRDLQRACSSTNHLPLSELGFSAVMGSNSPKQRTSASVGKGARNSSNSHSSGSNGSEQAYSVLEIDDMLDVFDHFEQWEELEHGL